MKTQDYWLATYKRIGWKKKDSILEKIYVGQERIDICIVCAGEMATMPPPYISSDFLSKMRFGKKKKILHKYLALSPR